MRPRATRCQEGKKNGRERCLIMDAVVYTTRGCQACRLTIKALADQGVHVESVQLEDNPRAADLVAALGYQQAPVVTTGDRWWSGFRLDQIKAVADA